MSDMDFLARAIELSKKSLTDEPGGPFGAVIVKDGKVISEGWNEVTSTNDPTAHAEMQAIRKAGKVMGDFRLSGAVIYSSCEPCPMCLAAIYWARIERVVYANSRTDAARIGFDDAYIYAQLSLDVVKREIPCLHLPSLPAQAVFEAWAQKANKKAY